MIYAVLFVCNLATLYEMYMCDKNSGFIRSLVLRYLGTTMSIGWLMAILGVVVILLMVLSDGAVAAMIEVNSVATGITPFTFVYYVVLGILWGSFNAVALAVIDQCQGGGSNRRTATILTVAQLVYYGWHLFNEYGRHMMVTVKV